MSSERHRLLCDCGFEVSAKTEDELVSRAKQHALAVHHMEMNTEQVLLAAFRAELAANETWPRATGPSS